jgi:hypothetical protein
VTTMSRRQAWLRRGLTGIGLAAPLALAPALPIMARPAPAMAESDDFSTMVDVVEVESDPALVRGKLVNRTSDTLQDLHLKVKDSFLFTTERHGSDDPSRAEEVRVAGPIPPGGSIPFRYPRPAPLPERTDGRFKTDVTVVQVTRQAVPVAPPAPAPMVPPAARKAE